MGKSANKARSLEEIERIDMLEVAIESNEGVIGLLRHMACSNLRAAPAEIDALCELLSSVSSTLCSLKDNMEASRTASQGTEYWRGYEDGKAAATTSARQKAATLPAGQ